MHLASDLSQPHNTMHHHHRSAQTAESSTTSLEPLGCVKVGLPVTDLLSSPSPSSPLLLRREGKWTELFLV